MNNSEKNKTVKLVVFLASVSAISGLLLGFVNSITAPVIEKNALSKQNESLEVIFPNAEFEKIEVKDTTYVTEAYIAKDLGYVYKIIATGYAASSPMESLIGLDNDGKVVGYQVLKNEETKGIGSKVADAEYVDKILSSDSTSTIDLLAGATISSTAISSGIHEAFDLFNEESGVVVDRKEPTAPSKETTVELVSNDDSTAVYKVSAFGAYGLNTFEITIDITSNKVVSVSTLEVLDTPEFVSKVANEEYLSKYVGVDGTTAKDVEVASGASLSTKSLVTAIEAAFADLSGDTGDTGDTGDEIIVDDETTLQAKILSQGFGGENLIVVTINKSDMTVKEIVFETVVDTPGICDVATDKAYLDTFVGLTSEEAASVDVAAGASVTSGSIKNAVSEAFKLAGGK